MPNHPAIQTAARVFSQMLDKPTVFTRSGGSIPVVGDFAGPKAVRGVGRYLAAHHAAVTVFYLSNVERYLFDAGDAWRRFYVNVAILPYDAGSLFIRTVFELTYFSSSLLSDIDETMAAFSGGRITKYGDVIALSR